MVQNFIFKSDPAKQGAKRGPKLLVAAALAAGAAVAVPSAAQARTSVVIGAHFGGPGYASSYYYRLHYWGGHWARYYYPYPVYRSTVVYRDYDGYRDYDHRQGLLASPYVQQALVADVGESVTWANAGVIGRVTITRDGWAGAKYCREFVERITIDESTRETTGTACQAEGGAWQMVANQP